MSRSGFGGTTQCRTACDRGLPSSATPVLGQRRGPRCGAAPAPAARPWPVTVAGSRRAAISSALTWWPPVRRGRGPSQVRRPGGKQLPVAPVPRRGLTGPSSPRTPSRHSRPAPRPPGHGPGHPPLLPRWPPGHRNRSPPRSGGWVADAGSTTWLLQAVGKHGAPCSRHRPTSGLDRGWSSTDSAGRRPAAIGVTLLPHPYGRDVRSSRGRRRDVRRTTTPAADPQRSRIRRPTTPGPGIARDGREPWSA